MPRAFKLTWEQGPRRWRKVYRGHTYTISCRELGAPENKEQSYQLANAWWEKKKAAIDAENRTSDDLIVKTLRERLAWAQEKGELELARHIEEHIENDRLYRDEMRPSVHRLWVLGGPEVGLIWDDRLRRDKPRPIDQEKTLSARIAKWLELQEARIGNEPGQLSDQEYQNKKYCLGHFERMMGSNLPIDQFNAERVEDFYKQLLEKVKAGDFKMETAKKVFTRAREFVRAQVAWGMLEEPRNLSARALKFEVVTGDPEYFTDKELRVICNEAAKHGALELYVMLALNTGMTQKDISDLKPQEVDWHQGMITRRRSKSRNKKTVPIVSYQLWPATFKLLETYRSREPERVLVGERGNPLVDKRGGKNNDAIRTAFYRLLKDLEGDKALKIEGRTFTSLRNTSARVINDHPEYGRITHLFLGQAPRTIAEKHYAGAAQGLLSKALDWLGVRLGFLPEEPEPPKS